MKKQYIKPEIKVEEMTLTVSILAASQMQITPEDEVDAASTTRRGTWGNLWD